MAEPDRTRQRPPLTREALDALLAFLHPDQTTAAAEYLKLRERLIHLFEWKGCRDADGCADETMDRVARKAQSGFETPPANPYTFVHAVAINVARESWRSKAHREDSLDETAASRLPSVDPRVIEIGATEASETARRVDCLTRSLDRMPRASRELLREYHLSAAGPNILRRKQMAQALDLPLTALRLRVFRLRRQLVKSVNRCLESAPGETK